LLSYFLFSLRKKLPAEDYDDQGTGAKKAKITLSRNPVQSPSVVAHPTSKNQTKAKLDSVNNNTMTGPTRGMLKISDLRASAVDEAMMRKIIRPVSPKAVFLIFVYAIKLLLLVTVNLFL